MNARSDAFRHYFHVSRTRTALMSIATHKRRRASSRLRLRDHGTRDARHDGAHHCRRRLLRRRRPIDLAIIEYARGCQHRASTIRPPDGYGRLHRQKRSPSVKRRSIRALDATSNFALTPISLPFSTSPDQESRHVEYLIR